MKRLLDYGIVAISAAAFGTLGIFGRYAYADGMNTLTVMAVRFALAAAVMSAWLAVRRTPLPRGSALVQLIGMGAVGYVAQAFAYLSALKYASAGLVGLLLYLYPAFVALLSAIFLHEKISRAKVTALVLAVAGAALTAGPASGQALGAALAILGAAIYSMYILVGNGVLKQVSAAQSGTVIFASAAVSAGVLAAIQGPAWPQSVTGWLAMAGMALVATVLAAVAFLAGVRRIGPTNAAMLSTLEPVVTVILAAALLGERLAPLALVGGALILLAVLLLTRSELRHERTGLGEAASIPEDEYGK